MENTTTNTQNTETTKEETHSLLEELKGDKDKKEGIDTTSFLYGMAAGAAITGVTIFIYNRFFNGD